MLSLTANQQLLAAAGRIEPLWVGVSTAGQALGLPDKTLLHAGPPFADATNPSAPVLSSAIICCLYEGWAANELDAERLIRTGRVALLPAHRFNLVTPLAAVVSPCSAVVEVKDRHSELRGWSMLSSGAGAQIRFGSRDIGIIERLRFRDLVLAPILQSLLHEHPIELLPLAKVGIAAGDDLHYQTTAANEALCQQLAKLNAEPELLDTVQQAPLFFLTLWMASCRLMANGMSESPAASESSLLVALAGNGEQLGLCVSSAPQQWRVMPATIPQGPSLPGRESFTTAPAIGDSGVIDALGFGAQLWHRLPQISTAMNAYYQADSERVDAVMSGWLESCQPQRVLSGMDIQRLQRQKRPLGVAIAKLDAEGRAGLLGKGVTELPCGPWDIQK